MTASVLSAAETRPAGGGALRLAPTAPASDQLPLVLVMIVFTIGGLGLLFGF